MSRDGADNLTISEEYTFTTLGAPATFITSNWTISLTDVDTGKEVTVSFLVTNAGDLAGSYEAALEIDGEVEATKEVTLDAGASEELTFTITKDVAGTYQITVDGLTLSFTVEEAPPPSTMNWWLIVVIIVGAVLLLILIILLARKFRLREKLAPGMLFPRRAELEPEQAVEEKAQIGSLVKEAKEKAKREAEEARERAEREHEEAKERGGILTVTPLAAEKLKEAIRNKTTDPEFGFRLVASPLKPNQLKMTLDREKEGDQVVESEGVKILILSPEIASALEGMVMDYQETPEGAGFSISELTTGTQL
jgi:Fe-S cluster assembly iron-binding protein IscA